MWKYYALLSAVFASLTAIFAKIGVKNINSDLATFIRTVIILLITFSIVLFGGHLTEVRNIPKHTWIFLILSGVATGFSWLFYFKAIQLGEVSRVAPLDKLSVVFTVVLSAIFLSENVTPRTIIGVILIATGSIFMCK